MKYGILEMLTSAVGGPLISKFLLPFPAATPNTVEGVIGEASKDPLLSGLLKDMTNDLAKDAGTKTINWTREKGIDKLKGTERKTEDLYKPVGTSPEKFWAALDLGMRTRYDAVNFLTLCRESADVFSLGTARLMRLGFKQSAYCRDAPSPQNLSSDDYSRPMELGLWIAWGRSLNTEYWYTHSAETNAEVYDFDGILTELVDTLGVPADQVSDVQWLRDHSLKAHQKVDVQYGWKPRPAKQPRWFNPYRFIRYCKNSSNISAWLGGLALHPEGLHIATRKWARLH